MEREVGGGIGMGNTCKPMAVSFQCMTKFTTNKKKKKTDAVRKSKTNKGSINIILSLMVWTTIHAHTLSEYKALEWLIHVNVSQKPLQYCKIISLQLI